MKSRPWTMHDENRLREHYGTLDPEALAILLDRTPTAVRTRAQRLGITARQFWTAAEDARLIAEYPHSEDTNALAASLGRSIHSLQQRVYFHGLHKTPETKARIQARTNRTLEQAGIGHRFRAGQTSWNAGLKGWQPEGCQATQFKKGQRPHTWKPVGTERVTTQGYRQLKVADEGRACDRWHMVHVIMWEQAHGPVPPGHIVVFKNGDKQDIRLDNLECISRAEHAKRNAPHGRWPPELISLRMHLGWVKRVIRQRTEEENEKCATN
jgi:hypothetical protein